MIDLQFHFTTTGFVLAVPLSVFVISFSNIDQPDSSYLQYIYLFVQSQNVQKVLELLTHISEKLMYQSLIFIYTSFLFLTLGFSYILCSKVTSVFSPLPLVGCVFHFKYSQGHLVYFCIAFQAISPILILFHIAFLEYIKHECGFKIQNVQKGLYSEVLLHIYFFYPGFTCLLFTLFPPTPCM